MEWNMGMLAENKTEMIQRRVAARMFPLCTNFILEREQRFRLGQLRVRPSMGLTLRWSLRADTDWSVKHAHLSTDGKCGCGITARMRDAFSCWVGLLGLHSFSGRLGCLLSSHIEVSAHPFAV